MEQNPTDLTGKDKRDSGIAQAVLHAEAVTPGWAEQAEQFLFQYLRTGQGKFLCEDVRAFAQQHGLPDPPSKRAWGGVMASAARAGVIRQAGYGKVKNAAAHCTPAALWEPCLDKAA